MSNPKEIKTGYYLEQYEKEQLQIWNSLPKEKKKIFLEYASFLSKNTNSDCVEYVLKNNLNLGEIDLTIIPEYLINSIYKGLKIDYSLL